jgi:hypothetical protein
MGLEMPHDRLRETPPAMGFRHEDTLDLDIPAVVVHELHGAAHHELVAQVPAEHGDIRALECRNAFEMVALRRIERDLVGVRLLDEVRGGRVGRVERPDDHGAVSLSASDTRRRSKRSPSAAGA